MARVKRPLWADIFELRVLHLAKKTLDGIVYSEDQEDLEILKKTGKGNCLALSQLLAEILRKRKVSNAFMCCIYPTKKKKNNDGHAFVMVHSKDGRKVWVQHNHTVACFNGLEEIMYFFKQILNWRKRGLKIGFCLPISRIKKIQP